MSNREQVVGPGLDTHLSGIKIYSFSTIFWCPSRSYIFVSNPTSILGEVIWHRQIDILSVPPLWSHLIMFLLKNFQCLFIFKLNSLHGQLDPQASPLLSSWQLSLNLQCLHVLPERDLFPSTYLIHFVVVQLCEWENSQQSSLA